MSATSSDALRHLALWLDRLQPRGGGGIKSRGILGRRRLARDGSGGCGWGGGGLLNFGLGLVFVVGGGVVPGGLALLPLLLLALLALRDGQLGGEPVDAPPQAGAQDGEDEAVDVVGGDEEEEEDELEGGEGAVGGLEEGGRRAGRKDALPELDEEGRHGGGGVFRGVRV